jgi:hypothetical protein
MLADTTFAPDDLYPSVSTRNLFHPCVEILIYGLIHFTFVPPVRCSRSSL